MEDFIKSEGQKIIVFTDLAVSFCVQASNYYVKVSEESAKYNWKTGESINADLFQSVANGIHGAGSCYLLSVVTVFSRCWK